MKANQEVNNQKKEGRFIKAGLWDDPNGNEAFICTGSGDYFKPGGGWSI